MKPIIIIGGGPAGATAAGLLRQHGREVVLLERSRHPRHHVGESLQPASFEILKKHLALEDTFAHRNFANKYGAVYIWGETREPWTILFDERLETDLPGLDEAGLLAGDYEHAYQVQRSTFDKILFDRAEELGTDCRQNTGVSEILMDGGRACGVVLQDGTRLESDWVIDASGQACLAGRQLGLVENVSDMRAVATYGYFKGAGGVPGPLGRHVQLVVSIPEGWIWFIPVSPDLTSVGVVSQRSEKIGREDFLRLIDRPDIPQGELVALDGGPELHYSRDWSYRCKQASAPGLFLTGDAVCFVDPILSGGVDFAIRSAANAAIAILSIDDGVPEESVRKHYEANISKEYKSYLRMARYWYGNNRSVDSYFWKAHEEIEADSLSTPVRAFVYLTSGKHAVDQHFKIFQEWQEHKMFRALGVNKQEVRSKLEKKRG